MCNRNPSLGKIILDFFSNNGSIYKIIENWIKESSNLLMNLSNQKVRL